jgi:hypothetical protein
MLELDLALHGLPGQPRAAEPIVIPVFYDSPEDIVLPDNIKQRWQARLDAAPGAAGAVPADRRERVRPDEWAQNVSDTQERLQNVRRLTEGAAKDEDLQVARAVVVAALAAARVSLAEPDGLVGVAEQEERLLAELAMPDPQRLGLWLHGMGGCNCEVLRAPGWLVGGAVIVQVCWLRCVCSCCVCLITGVAWA